MTLEKRNGQVEIVWNDDGQTVKGLALHSYLFTVDGDFVRTVVEPLTAVDDPTVNDLAAKFSAAVVAERDALIIERDNALAQVDPLQAQVATLQAQLDAILNPPGPDLTTVDGAKAYMATERNLREEGGITVGDQPVTTHRDEMPVWIGMMLDIVLRPGERTEFEYKPRGGSNVTLTAQQVMRCYECFGWYVSECFAVERRLRAELDAGTPIADVLSQIPAAWPQTAFEWVAPV